MKTACLAMFFLSGCVQNFPKEIWIDERFSSDEEAVLLWDMHLWELQTERDLFTYRGRTKVNSFRKENLSDETHIIYKVDDKDEMSEDERRVYDGTDDLEPGVGGHPSGWATPEDILIYSFRLKFHFDDYYLIGLHATAEHELGHFLGLGHIAYDPDAVMNPGNGPQKCIKASDLEAFCSVNYCESSFDPGQSEENCIRSRGRDVFLTQEIVDASRGPMGIDEFFDLW